MAAAVILAGGEAMLRRLADGERLEAKELHAWAGAMKLANDAKTTAELLEQRNRPARPPAPPPPQKPAAPNVVQLQQPAPPVREAV